MKRISGMSEKVYLEHSALSRYRSFVIDGFYHINIAQDNARSRSRVTSGGTDAMLLAISLIKGTILGAYNTYSADLTE